MKNAVIVGFGGMGNYHRKSLAKEPGMRAYGVYDINPEKMKVPAAEGLHLFHSFEEVLRDPAVDVLILSVPNNFHHDMAIQALEAGKNVISEKPVALNSKELEEMIAASKRAGKIFTVHQNRRWDTDYRIVKKSLADNLIGKPFYIESRVQGSNGVPGDWRCVKSSGGGMLLDWGVHLIDQMLYLVKSPVVSIFTHMLSIRFKDVDDNFKVLLRFENGLSALVEVDTWCLIPLPRWHVSGTDGTLVVRGWDNSGEIVRVKERTEHWEPGIVYTAAGPTRTMAPRPIETLEKLPLPHVETDELDFYRNVAAAIDGKEELLVKPSEALRVMNVIDAVFLSAKTGASVACHI